MKTLDEWLEEQKWVNWRIRAIIVDLTIFLTYAIAGIIVITIIYFIIYFLFKINILK